MRRAHGRSSTLTPEQVEAIQESTLGIVESSVAIAARCSHWALELTMALDSNTPNIRERLKPIAALAKIMNRAFFLAVRLEPSLLHAASVEFSQAPADPLAPAPVAPVVLVCLPPLERAG